MRQAVRAPVRLCADHSRECGFPSGTDSFCDGLWATSGGDFAWTRGDSNGTHIAGTGPASGPGGGAYAYTFAGGYSRRAFLAFTANRPHKTAYLTAAAGDYVGISFWYHMYGADVVRLAVEAQVWHGVPAGGTTGSTLPPRAMIDPPVQPLVTATIDPATAFPDRLALTPPPAPPCTPYC